MTSVLPPRQAMSSMSRSAGWSVIGGLVDRGAFVLACAVASNCLGVIEFGRLGAVLGLVAVVQTYAAFSMGGTATKHVAQYRDLNPAKAQAVAGMCIFLSVALGCVVAGALATMSGTVASWALKDTELSTTLALSGVWIMVSVLRNTLAGVLAGHNQFAGIARSNIAAGLLSFPLVGLGSAYAGVVGAVLGFLAGALVGLAYNLVQVGAVMRLSPQYLAPRCWSEHAPLIWKFSVPTFVVGLLPATGVFLTQTILIHSGAQIEQIAYFSAALQISNGIGLLPMLVSRGFLPEFSRRHASGDRVAFVQALRAAIKANLVLALAVGAAVFLAAKLLMRVYGGDFTVGADVLRLMVGSVLMTATVRVIEFAYLGIGRAWTTVGLRAVWFLSLGVMALHWQNEGAIGLGKANCVASLLHFIASAVAFRYALVAACPKRANSLSTPRLNGD